MSARIVAIQLVNGTRWEIREGVGESVSTAKACGDRAWPTLAADFTGYIYTNGSIPPRQIYWPTCQVAHLELEQRPNVREETAPIAK